MKCYSRNWRKLLKICSHCPIDFELETEFVWPESQSVIHFAGNSIEKVIQTLKADKGEQNEEVGANFG